MTAMRDPDRLIRAFLDEGPTELPDRSYEAVRAAIERARQRVVVVRWPAPRLRSLAAIGTAATTILVFVVVSLAVIGGPAPVVGRNESQVGQVWTNSADIALTVHRNAADRTDYYWRVATYNEIGARGWTSDPTTTVDRPAGSRLLDGKADDAVPAGRRSVTFTVDPGTFRGSTIVSPATPFAVNVGTGLSLVGRDGYFARIDRTDGGTGPYTVTAQVGQPGNGPGQWNVTALRAAGTDYPTEVVDLYLGVPPEIIGPSARALEDEILANAGQDATPIDKVEAMMAALRSNAFTYNTDVTDLPCETLSTVECFAQFKQGFCQYYAATMAVLLRDMGVPTRIAEGFLPGERSGADEVIRNRNASSWVEVYFPGDGWVTFDPTGSNQGAQLPAALPTGS